MAAVQDQRRQLEKWRAKFTPTVTRQLNNLFIHLVSCFARQVVCSHSLIRDNRLNRKCRVTIPARPAVRAQEVQALRRPPSP